MSAIHIYSPCKILEEIAERQEKDPIVQKVQKIDIPGLKFGYNPSIVSVEERNYLFFRYDVENIYEGYGNRKIKSFTACAVFDSKMETLLEVKEIALDSFFAEDARAIYFQGHIYLFYNKPLGTPLDAKFRLERRMCVAKLDPESFEVLDQQIMQFDLFPVEKNWIPFVMKEPSGKEGIFLIHHLKNFRILRLDLTNLSVVYPYFIETTPLKPVIDWGALWGPARGGTPAIQVDDEFVMFFHSCYVPKGHGIDIRYYVMGALVFEAAPPFKLKKMSTEPLVFDEMYASTFRRSNQFTVYPAGVCYDPKKEEFLVSVGENDRAMKIVHIDKNALYRQLLDIL
ncbi:MAG: hypothetical protein ACOYK9_05160 [Chlamydiia bacterium]